MEYICNICSRKFNNSQQLNAHKRSHKPDKNYNTSKLKEYTNKIYQDNVKEHIKTSPKCRYCFEILSYEKRNNKFCDNTCSSNFSHIKNKNKTKSSVCIECSKPTTIHLHNSSSNTRCIECTKLHKRNLQTKYEFRHISKIPYSLLECSICKTLFQTKIYNKKQIKKTCSKKCMRELCSINSKGKCGGIRENSGFGKQSKYTKSDGEIINCQSTMELAICNVLDDLKLTWKRNLIGFSYLGLDECEHLYYPDFYIENFNVFLETKGFFTIDTIHKLLTTNLPNLVVVTYKKWGGNFEDILKNPEMLLTLLETNDKTWIETINSLPNNKKYRYRVLPPAHMGENHIS